jgi:hypothetical protein
MRRALRSWLVGWAILLLGPLSSRAQDPLEYTVKAAYLTKFVPFINWPEQQLAAGAPITICIVGEDPFGLSLDKAAAAAGAGGRPLVIRRIATTDTAETQILAKCQIAYAGDPLTSLDVIDALKGKPVVTVTDSGMRARGVISFVMQDNHVRFDIDDAAAEKSGIHFSSKLLELARAVNRRSENP